MSHPKDSNAFKPSEESVTLSETAESRNGIFLFPVENPWGVVNIIWTRERSTAVSNTALCGAHDTGV